MKIDKDNIPDMQALSGLLGQDICGMAVAGLSDPQGGALAWLDLRKATPGQNLVALCHGIAMEGDFLQAVINFDDAEEPVYLATGWDMAAVAAHLELPMVMCLVVMAKDGRVMAMRNYDGVEVTCLETVRDQFLQFRQKLAGGGAAMATPPGLLN